jgi:hypothetical protein
MNLKCPLLGQWRVHLGPTTLRVTKTLPSGPTWIDYNESTEQCWGSATTSRCGAKFWQPWVYGVQGHYYYGRYLGTSNIDCLLENICQVEDYSQDEYRWLYCPCTTWLVGTILILYRVHWGRMGKKWATSLIVYTTILTSALGIDICNWPFYPLIST